MKRLLGIALTLLGILMAFGASALSLTVSYDEPTCTQDTLFTLTGTQGSGNYKYMLNSISVWDNGSWTLVIDPSRKRYQEDNCISFRFTASGRYMLYFYVMDMTALKTVRKIEYITINEEGYPTVEEIVQRLSAECLQAGCEDDYSKALWMHNWLTDHSNYDNALLYCSAEGVLARGIGTCESYHRAYEKLLDAVGVEHGRVVGNGHVWTAVKIDGKWCQTDVTWDTDPITISPTFRDQPIYFGLTDELMTLLHSDHAGDQSYPSTYPGNAYLIRSGKIGTWIDPLKTQIQTHLNALDEEFTLDPDPKVYDNYNRTIVYTLAAWQIQQMEWSSSAARGTEVSCEYTGGKLSFHCSYAVNSVDLPASLTAVPEEAFAGDVAVEIVTVHEGTVSIGARAFSGCTSLKKITVPESVQSIAENAFEGSSGISFICKSGSYAESYAQSKGFNVIHPEEE